ncbi:MAG: hypothetical protein K2M43_03230 [Mycoplasmoidaceae bacterium]|nr:hypothetical protein [Mycoplasmoidaceae bacterium]
MTGHAPEIQVTEGGVETGVLLKKYPNMAAICIGPTILHAHSFDEKAEIEAVGVIYNILLELLKSIDKKD